MENNEKEFFEKQLEASQIKVRLIEKGIASTLESKKYDIDTLQKCFKVLETEKSNEKYYKNMFDKAVSGELEKRERAREVLGLNKVN